MAYFKNVKVGDKVFGFVFGLGVVSKVWEHSFYSFEVEYESNGIHIPYSIEGIPGWSNGLGIQTAFYKQDIDLMDYDFAPSDEILSIKKIIRLRDKGKLEVRCPSGLWNTYDKCPINISEGYLESAKLHLFRKSR